MKISSVRGCAAVLLAATLAGCSAEAARAPAATQVFPVTVPPEIVERRDGYGIDTEQAVHTGPVAVRLEGNRLGLTTVGSGGCPSKPVALTYRSPSELVVELKRTPPDGRTSRWCVSADLTWATFVLQLDGNRVAADGPLTVHLGEESDALTLVAEPAPEIPRPDETAARVSLVAGGRLEVTTFSGSCPLKPVKLVYRGTSVVEVRMQKQQRGTLCIWNDSPATNVVELNEKHVDLGAPIDVHLVEEKSEFLMKRLTPPATG